MRLFATADVCGKIHPVLQLPTGPHQTWQRGMEVRHALDSWHRFSAAVLMWKQWPKHSITLITYQIFGAPSVLPYVNHSKMGKKEATPEKSCWDFTINMQRANQYCVNTRERKWRGNKHERMKSKPWMWEYGTKKEGPKTANESKVWFLEERESSKIRLWWHCTTL